MKYSKFPVPKVREEIKNFAPYIPGRPIDEVKKKYNLKEVIKLASNENPLGSSKKILVNIKNIVKNIHRYPEGSSLVLREEISKKFGISKEEVIVGAGTDELIEIVAKTFLSLQDNIVVSKHAFIRYKMAGELMGVKVVEVPMKEFTHDLDSMLSAIDNKTKIVFIANPNNPTGTYNTEKQLKSFLTGLVKKKCFPIVVLDEAYYEYARVEKEYPESLTLRNIYPNILILRTFSKVYGLAGLRVGFGISRREIISAMDRVRPPFNVSVFAQYLACEAIKDQNHVRKSVEMIDKEKKFIYQQLNVMGLKFIPSAANFVLVNVSPYTGQEIFQELLKEGVIVRAMDEYELPFWFRVTISTHSENLKFIDSLEKVLKKLCL